MIRKTFSWIVGIFFIVALVGIGYYYYVYQTSLVLAAHEHTSQMTKRALELQEKADHNGLIIAEILKSNAQILARIDEMLYNHSLELNVHRSYIVESHVKLHDELAKIAKIQKEDTVEDISKYLQQSREMYLDEFAKLREDFKVNRELHKQTQRFLKIPQEDK